MDKFRARLEPEPGTANLPPNNLSTRLFQIGR